MKFLNWLIETKTTPFGEAPNFLIVLLYIMVGVLILTWLL